MDGIDYRGIKSAVRSLIGADDAANRMFYLGLIAELEREEPRTRRFFSPLLESFVRLDFDEEAAAVHWRGIVDHSKALSSQLNRRVSVHVAVLDYFTMVNRALDLPVFVESHHLKSMEKLAMLDGLTGAFNRRYMDIALRKELNRASRYRKALGLILLDLDDFKRFNDERGHVYGDSALKELARFLKESVRDEDMVCRYGGEEFLVILPETNADGAYRLAERMRMDARAKGFFSSGGITFSAGIAAYPEAGMSAQELVIAADKALYQAKSLGKDRVVKAAPERRRYSRFHQSWAIDILDRVSSGRAEDGLQGPRSVVTENVSVGGAKIACGARFDVNDALSLHIRTADSASEDLSAIGKITWMKKNGQDRFDYGLSFVNLPPAAAERFVSAAPELGA